MRLNSWMCPVSPALETLRPERSVVKAAKLVDGGEKFGERPPEFKGRIVF